MTPVTASSSPARKGCMYCGNTGTANGQPCPVCTVRASLLGAAALFVAMLATMTVSARKISPGNNSAGDGHKSGGGPAPAGNGSKPVHSCSRCGTMYTGNSHTCH